jgi:hypothetical protein
MAYTTANPPKLLKAAIAGGPALWSYRSADAKATVVGAGYISNARELGMAAGDFVLVHDSNVPTVSFMGVLTFTASAANLGYVAVA